MTPSLAPAELPYLERIILIPAVLAHGFALTGLLGGWSAYRVPEAAAALLAASMALPVALVAVPRRTGGRLPTWAAVSIVGGVFAVSVAVPALLPANAQGLNYAWNWGTGGMTLLGVALYLSTLRIVVLAFAHAAVGVVLQLLAGAGAWGCHLVLVASLVPPLGAAQYLRFYADALRERSRAVSARLDSEAGRRELDVVRLADHRRLGGLRAEIEPLLEHVAAGGELPLEAGQATLARQLAERLRAALVAQRRALWLPEQLGTAPVTVVCSEATARAVGSADRAWLAAVLELLDGYPAWRAVRVVLDLRSSGSVEAVVTAEGPCAGFAAGDGRLRALADGVGGRIDVESDMMSVDATLGAMIGA